MPPPASSSTARLLTPPPVSLLAGISPEEQARVDALPAADRAWLQACVGDIPTEQDQLFEALARLDDEP